MSPVDVVRNIEDAVVSLYRLGARDVMVVNLPDLGKVPANGGDPNATLISQVHNSLLGGAVARLRTRFPNLRLVLVDLVPLFEDLETRMDPSSPLIAVYSPWRPKGRRACL